MKGELVEVWEKAKDQSSRGIVRKISEIGLELDDGTPGGSEVAWSQVVSLEVSDLSEHDTPVSD